MKCGHKKLLVFSMLLHNVAVLWTNKGLSYHTVQQHSVETNESRTRNQNAHDMQGRELMTSSSSKVTKFHRIQCGRQRSHGNNGLFFSRHMLPLGMVHDDFDITLGQILVVELMS